MVRSQKQPPLDQRVGVGVDGHKHAPAIGTDFTPQNVRARVCHETGNGSVVEPARKRPRSANTLARGADTIMPSSRTHTRDLKTGCVGDRDKIGRKGVKSEAVRGHRTQGSEERKERRRQEERKPGRHRQRQEERARGIFHSACTHFGFQK